MNRDHMLLGVVRILGAYFLLVFLASKSPHATALFLKDAYAFGDLYQEAKIRLFKIPLPAKVADPEPRVREHLTNERMLLIGDSFFDSCRGTPRFPYRLAAALGQTVFYRSDYVDPLQWLQATAPTTRSNRPRILILESVERILIKRFAGNPLTDKENPVSWNQSGWRRQLDLFRDRWFVNCEAHYDFFLRNGPLSSSLVEAWCTLEFALTRRITPITSVFSIKPPFLFYDQETDPKFETSFYHAHPDELIQHIADRLKRIQQELRARHGIELVFMPIPNKFTIYHHLVTDAAYDGFLPRLCDALEARDILTVRLYERYMKESRLLYCPTDTHWNKTGMDLALDETLKILARLPPSF